MSLAVQVLVLLRLPVIPWLELELDWLAKDVEFACLLSSFVSLRGNNENKGVLCEQELQYWNHFEYNQCSPLVRLFPWYWSFLVVDLTHLKRRSAPQLQRAVC